MITNDNDFIVVEEDDRNSGDEKNDSEENESVLQSLLRIVANINEDFEAYLNMQI